MVDSELVGGRAERARRWSTVEAADCGGVEEALAAGCKRRSGCAPALSERQPRVPVAASVPGRRSCGPGQRWPEASSRHRVRSGFMDSSGITLKILNRPCSNACI